MRLRAIKGIALLWCMSSAISAGHAQGNSWGPWTYLPYSPGLNVSFRHSPGFNTYEFRFKYEGNGGVYSSKPISILRYSYSCGGKTGKDMIADIKVGQIAFGSVTDCTSPPSISIIETTYD